MFRRPTNLLFALFESWSRAGTVFALSRRVVQLAGTILLANVGLSTEGCLLGNTVLDADAGRFLLPLIPPVIKEERSLEFPAPGDIVILRAPMGGGSVTQQFEVTVLYDAPAALQVRIFRGRDRPCTDDAPGTCGTFVSSGLVVPRTGTQLERKISFSVSMTVPGECTAVDLYVSPEFKNDVPGQHEPVRPGEVAHARWFVAVEQINRDLPSLRLCNDLSAAGR